MQWYYLKNGTQRGPIDADEISAKVASGEIAPTDLVWREGMGDWLPSAQVSELRAAVPVAPNVYAPRMAQLPKAHNPADRVVPVSGKATTALVLGICGIISAFGCWPVGFVLSILAIVFGSLAKTQIHKNPHLIASLSAAKGGVIMGWVSLGLAVAMLILGLLLRGVR